MKRRLRVAHVAASDLTHRFLLDAQMQALREAGFEVTAISAPGPWVPSLEAEGIRHLAWPNIARALDFRADLKATAELARLLRRERFDLVHTHTLKASLIGRVAARACRVPCIVNTVYGLYATREDPWAKRTAVLTLEAAASRFSDCELHVSREDVAWLRRRRVMPAAKLRWIGAGVDLNYFHPQAVSTGRARELRHELGIADGDLVVGAVGRLVAKKGFREFFDVARRVRATDQNIRFVAVGERDTQRIDVIDPQDMERAIDDATADVVFTGWRTDVRDLLGVMDVWALPSWREGLPVSAMEAAAMGRPMILGDVRGCREVGSNEQEALLVPPRDSTALEAAVRRLLDDPRKRRRLGQAARERAERVFDQARVAERLLEVYESLLLRRGLPHPFVPGAPPPGTEAA